MNESEKKDQEAVIRDLIIAQRHTDYRGSHHGIPLHRLVRAFRKECDRQIGPLIDEMVKRNELIAVYWDHSFGPDFVQRHEAYFFKAYPDRRYPRQFDPQIYLPEELPRSLIRFAYRAPNATIKDAIQRRKERTKKTA